jgi:PAS domain S-box-containing protein
MTPDPEASVCVCVCTGCRAETEALRGSEAALENRLAELTKELTYVKAALNEHAIVAFTDHRGRILFVNDKFCAISQYSREELIGHDHRIINSGHHSKEFIRALWTTISSGQVWKGEIKNRAKDGSFYWVDTTIVPFLDAAGSPTQFVAIRNDITERKKGEEALRESADQFRTMANSIPALAWVAHADGYIFWYNQRWHEYTGTTPEQMQGWGWKRVHDPKVLPSVLERWTAAIATGQPFEMQFPLRRVDGIFRPFLTRVIPLKDDAGRVLQWIGTNTDITTVMQSEEALLEGLGPRPEHTALGRHHVRALWRHARPVQRGIRGLGTRHPPRRHRPRA